MTVAITKEEYLELKDAKQKLLLLEQGGVDNWEFYGEALDGYKSESDLYQEAGDLLNEISIDAHVDYPAGRDAGHQILFSDKAIETIVDLLRAQDNG